MSKHTRGPWEVGTDPVYVGIPHTRAGVQWVRCLGELSEAADEEDYANARLIAAAPELLEALRFCLTDDLSRAMTDESRNAAHYARRRLDAINATVRAAILRATGEELEVETQD